MYITDIYIYITTKDTTILTGLYTLVLTYLKGGHVFAQSQGSRCLGENVTLDWSSKHIGKQFSWQTSADRNTNTAWQNVDRHNK